jgi:hypothetical protein
MVLAVVMLLVGCSQTAPSFEKQQKREAPQRIENAPPRDLSADLPAYDITLERDCAESGVVGKCYRVSTDATSREELEAVTAKVWLDSPEYLAVLVTFYPNKPTANASAWGFAFENEQAARVVLAQFLAQGTSVEDEVGEAMGNGGIYVVVPADEARELTQDTALGRGRRGASGGGLLSPSYGKVLYPPHLLKGCHYIFVALDGDAFPRAEEDRLSTAQVGLASSEESSSF